MQQTIHRPAAASELGRTLVFVPHPDDETIGCGGLLALLAAAGQPVCVVLVSDGAASHPRSRLCLRSLRLLEMQAALQALGLDAHRLIALGLPDGQLPWPGHAAFERSVELAATGTAAFRPDTVLLPWRHDSHPDHRATHALGTAVCEQACPEARRFEYPVWMPEERVETQGFESCTQWSIDVSTVVEKKRLALARHRSQLGQVVHDDPQGFTLPAALIDYNGRGVETYFAGSSNDG